jgi:TrmH family RNA methyltransferase
MLVGASPWAEQSYREAEYTRPVILMLGNETHGLSDEELEVCHQQVSIPMVGRRDSLNVGVAGAVILYEVFARGSVSYADGV